MKRTHLRKFPVALLVFGLIVINILLLCFFLAPASHPQTNPDNSIDWRLENYPEIIQLQNSNWDFQKLTQFFQDLSKEKGGEYAYHALTIAANKGYIPVNADIHLLGHAVGDILYEQQGIEGIKVCTDDIRNACSHSIVVGYLLDNGEANLPKAVATCNEAPGGSGAYLMCVHGLGHGVLGYTEYDMRKAVRLCEKTGTPEYGSQEVGQCIGGVTMEMMAGVHDRVAWSKQTPNYFNKNNPLAPCDMGFIPKNSLNYCYVYLTPHLFQTAGADLGSPDPKYFGKAMSYCQRLPVGDSNRKTCFGSFGKEYVVLANARNVQSVENMSDDQLGLIYRWCTLGPKEAVTPCLDSALQSLYWGGENSPEVSLRFCTNIPDGKQSALCMRSLFDAVSYYKRGDISYFQALCSSVPEKYTESCRAKFSLKI